LAVFRISLVEVEAVELSLLRLAVLVALVEVELGLGHHRMP
jgi:hypothetical protein